VRGFQPVAAGDRDASGLKANRKIGRVDDLGFLCLPSVPAG
jgi:hypothetical protein